MKGGRREESRREKKGSGDEGRRKRKKEGRERGEFRSITRIYNIALFWFFPYVIVSK